MKRANSFFGAVLLMVAVTLAFIILFKPRERGGVGGIPRGEAELGAPRPLDWSREASARTKRQRAEPALWRVEPGDGATPQLLAQAKQVETVARKRLRDMAERLALTKAQQAEIFPLLARSLPVFDESLTIVDETGRRTGGRLTRRAADEGIHELLDPGQQEELIESIAEKDLWWAEVIFRLERDLERSTEPAEAPIPSSEAAAADAAPAPHRGRNLFELPTEGDK